MLRIKNEGYKFIIACIFMKMYNKNRNKQIITHLAIDLNDLIHI